MTRDEHLQWCKDRAHEYADQGDGKGAVTSMLSDLNKHEETRGSLDSLAPLAIMMLAAGQLSDVHDLKRFIDGFN